MKSGLKQLMDWWDNRYLDGTDGDYSFNTVLFKARAYLNTLSDRGVR